MPDPILKLYETLNSQGLLEGNAADFGFVDDDKHIRYFIRYYLGVNFAEVDEGMLAALENSPVVAAMPVYPDAGSMRLVDGVLPGMRSRGWGRIVAITSLTVKRPALNLPVSNAMRAAVTNHLRTLAMEVAVDGVTCNTVAPGYTATERLKRLHTDAADAQRLKASIPAQRFGEPEEVAAAVAFLASVEAAYITGQELLVDGGFTI